MAEGGLTLVDEVGVRMGGGRDAIVERVALAGYRLGAIAADMGEESRLAKARLGIVLGCSGSII